MKQKIFTGIVISAAICFYQMQAAQALTMKEDRANVDKCVETRNAMGQYIDYLTRRLWNAGMDNNRDGWLSQYIVTNAWQEMNERVDKFDQAYRRNLYHQPDPRQCVQAVMKFTQELYEFVNSILTRR